ncbi:FAD-dependent oxidoreductase [Telmatospirillum siberiense]|uniref:FAD-dependent oxidoreductase n=1 Tax=Telmatospirillum siberiense TaxID=382514 RepID=UPI00130444E2|nr:FAD-dependent oxidoreductase [Telmatospirillum siberiense]
MDETRKELRLAWRAAEDAPRPVRLALAQATRLATEIAAGRGSVHMLAALGRMAEQLTEFAPEMAVRLSASLSEFGEEWLHHAQGGVCAAGRCSGKAGAPCRAACPADIDIPGFLAHIGRGRYDEALRVIAKDNPLPHSCGLVCPAPCEAACLRGTVGSSLFIRPLKAVAAKHCDNYGTPERAPATGKRVAVVGSGPSGLTVAYYLAGKGHQVEIFEARDQAGGMLRYGIPSYRLPYEILDAEIDHIKSLGVSIHTGAEVSSVSDLHEQGFDAVYLAMGLQLSRRLGIEGDDLPFVIGGMDFLGGVGAGTDPRVGPRVIVVGGGNSAVDAAMTALRQGARHVSMVYRGRRREMRASPHEIELAVAEGVEILELWAPERVLPDNKMVFRRSSKATEEERRASGEFLTLDVDHVLVGIGQESALSCLEGSRVEIKAGHVVADAETGATSQPGVYAGGDVAHGASTVVAAIRAGKAAAASIHAFMMGEGTASAEPSPKTARVPPAATAAARRSSRLRPSMPQRDAGERKTTYQQIELGLAEADAEAEADRCLRCDICIGCGLCELVCSEVGAEALRMVETPAGRLVFDDFTRPISRCIGCGACAEACPTGAIRVEDRDGARSTIITGTVVRRQEMLSCRICHQPLVAEGQFHLVSDRLGRDGAMPLICPSCARRLGRGGAASAVVR